MKIDLANGKTVVIKTPNGGKIYIDAVVMSKRSDIVNMEFCTSENDKFNFYGNANIRFKGARS